MSHRGQPQASHKPIHSADEIAWMQNAACHGLPDHYYFPERSANITPQVRHICAACPVRIQCLEFALTYGEWHGIWGGLSERQRRALARQRERRTPRRTRGSAA